MADIQVRQMAPVKLGLWCKNCLGPNLVEVPIMLFFDNIEIGPRVYRACQQGCITYMILASGSTTH